MGFYWSNSNEFELTKSDISRIRDYAFSGENRSIFYSCNTGTTGESSFAQAWADRTGGTTWAFYGKSDYEHINDNQPFADRITRFLGDFRWRGSRNLPVAGENAYMSAFIPRRYD